MAGFDYTYYKESFRGELSEADFERFSPVAQDVISLLVGFDPSGRDEAALLRALCAQVDFAALSHRGGVGVRSESLGDYSVSYGEARVIAPSIYGSEVCPEALTALVAGGFLTRWA